jgi:hypothetical protein
MASNSLATGNHPAAIAQAEQGIRLARAYGNQQREGLLLIELGKIKVATGDLAAGVAAWRQAVGVLHPLFPNDEAAARALLAEYGG